VRRDNSRVPRTYVDADEGQRRAQRSHRADGIDEEVAGRRKRQEAARYQARSWVSADRNVR
jgi:hypothetical protein